MTDANNIPPVRIGNASGFYGDRFSAVKEMLTGGELDYLTGDYLAELTMMILGLDQMKSLDRGYARTFLRQMEQSMGLALDRGVKVVTNAGGLNPKGLVDALHEQAKTLGLSPKIAYITGDNLTDRAEEFGWGNPLAANAYLGGWGIVEALRSGADIVITGRVTDASLVVGPAAAHFGWSRDNWDALAGAVVAGHVIECGTQATGGNYSFFTEIAELHRPGFPIAEVFADGSSVITKHAGTDGAVNTGTVTAQLLYEIGSPRYLGPDVTAQFDTITLQEIGPDRVQISGVTGEAPPTTTKVGVNSIGGYRNEMTLILTGLDIEAKAELVKAQLAPGLHPSATWTLARTDHPDADTQQSASALLSCVVRSDNPDDIGRSFSNAAVELALGSYPGFTATAPPSGASPYGIFTPEFLEQSLVPHRVITASGEELEIPPPPEMQLEQPTETTGDATDSSTIADLENDDNPGTVSSGNLRRVPIGTIVGARSGDKGGSANIGLWVRSNDAYTWLQSTFTVHKLKELLPEAAPFTVRRYELPNLWALNFVIEDILGQGVSSNARFDPQAKGLGEWLRSRMIDIPEELL